jgi:hypothetical protein
MRGLIALFGAVTVFTVVRMIPNDWASLTNCREGNDCAFWLGKLTAHLAILVVSIGLFVANRDPYPS